MAVLMKSPIGVVAALAFAVVLGGCASQTPIAGTGPLTAGGAGGAGGAGAAATPGSAQDFVINVGDRVFFLEDQSTLTAEAQSTLSKQALWLNRYGSYTVTLQGHADERGTREYNLALGARRAQAVRDFLVAQGIDSSRLRTISFGKERPVRVCNDESCWSANRRAVTALDGAAGS